MTTGYDGADRRRRGLAAQRVGQGLLRDFNDAGVLDSSDVLVAQRLTELAGETDPRVALAVGFAVRACGRVGVRGPLGSRRAGRRPRAAMAGACRLAGRDHLQ